MSEQKGTILITGSSGRIGYPRRRPADLHQRPIPRARHLASAECLYVD
jgi:hypothetical protein